jgi:hypothetical protein
LHNNNNNNNNNNYNNSLSIDVALPSERDVIRKEAEKKLKCKKCRNSSSVAYERLPHIDNHWGHWNCKKRTKKYVETIPVVFSMALYLH